MLTIGEFAKLAGTTKRTIAWYEQKGVLIPSEKRENGYRYYKPEQILDYQMILLLSTLGTSLSDIKKLVDNKKSLTEQFNENKFLIHNKLELLKFNLNSLESYLSNIEKNGTMVNPVISVMKPIDIYYIEKVGPYVKIKNYIDELASCFSNKGDSFVTLSIFENQVYKPDKSKIIIGVIKNDKMKIKNAYRGIVKEMKFNPKKVISYKYRGSSNMLSFFWKELEKYCKLNNIKPRATEPDFEIYRKVNSNPAKQIFEIFIPIY